MGEHGQRDPMSGRGMGDERSGSGFRHEPVMLREVLEILDPVPDGLVLDATVGGAGHAGALLERRPGISLLAIDRDPAALAAAGERLARFSDRVRLVDARFGDLGDLLGDGSGQSLVGALFDLGVSSPQLDEPDRGFSFSREAPLDMRMDPRSGPTAAELLAAASEAELATWFAESGEDRFARRIARAVVAARPITTTTELADVVVAAVPAAARRRGHPARRVFQALRLAVNAELEQLQPAIEAAVSALVPGGRVVVLAYHSGEDRIVKRTLASLASGGCVCPPGLPCVCGAQPVVRLLSRGARKPGPEEIARNPRASAARLRAAERLAGAPDVDAPGVPAGEG